jgi:hypothetical protein
VSGLPEVPERYELHFVDYNAASIYMRDDGEYVLHEDYADLRAAAEKLQEALTQSRVLEEQTFRNNADLRAENEALRKFAQRVMDDWPDGSNMDGGELQDIAHECGLLKDIIRTESCGDNCGCAEYYSDEEFAEGVTCYTRTALLTGNAMQASAAEDKDAT